MQHRDMKWLIAVGKMVLLDLFDEGGHKSSICKKQKQNLLKPQNNLQYLQSLVEQGMPPIPFLSPHCHMQLRDLREYLTW